MQRLANISQFESLMDGTGCADNSVFNALTSADMDAIRKSNRKVMGRFGGLGGALSGGINGLVAGGMGGGPVGALFGGLGGAALGGGLGRVITELLYGLSNSMVSNQEKKRLLKKLTDVLSEMEVAEEEEPDVSGIGETVV